LVQISSSGVDGLFDCGLALNRRRHRIESAHPEEPIVIASYRGAVARAAPSMVTVQSAQLSAGALPSAPRVPAKSLGAGAVVDSGGYIVNQPVTLSAIHHAGGRVVAAEAPIPTPTPTLHRSRSM
jgi:hypothetical protein